MRDAYAEVLHRNSLEEHRRNEEIRSEAKIMSIRDIMWEIRLEWFGHVCHCERDQDIRREYEMRTEGSRGSGQQKQRWSDTSMLVRSRLK